MNELATFVFFRKNGVLLVGLLFLSVILKTLLATGLRAIGAWAEKFEERGKRPKTGQEALSEVVTTFLRMVDGRDYARVERENERLQERVNFLEEELERERDYR